MKEQIMNTIIALLPSITAVLTVIVSCISVVNELRRKTSAIKNDVESFNETNKLCRELVRENIELKEKYGKLLDEVVSQNILLERMANVEQEWQELGSRIESAVTEELQKGFKGVNRAKNDLSKLGEITNEQ